jgi:hypothetical protein
MMMDAIGTPQLILIKITVDDDDFACLLAPSLPLPTLCKPTILTTRSGR